MNLALEASLEAAPSLFEFLVLVVVGPEGSGEVVKFSLVFLPDLGQGHGGGVLLVDQFAEGSLSLDEAVWDVHLLAEGGEPDDQLDGLNVVGDGDELGFLVFDELGDVVESELEVVGFALGDLFF